MRCRLEKPFHLSKEYAVNKRERELDEAWRRWDFYKIMKITTEALEGEKKDENKS